MADAGSVEIEVELPDERVGTKLRETHIASRPQKV
jgi:hypothetical protein